MQNTLKQLIEQWENRNLTKFRYSRQMKDHIGINQKKFWCLVRNEIEISEGEKVRIANFFKIQPESITQTI